MPNVRLATAALNQTPVDWDGNLRRVVEAIDQAREAGAGLLCMPELCLSGYGCEDLFFAAYVEQRARRSLGELIPRTEGIAVAVGLPLRVDGVLYNAQAMIADRRLLGFTLKQFLANDGIHYEARWFTAWPVGTQGTVEFDGSPLPIGELIYDFDGVGVGMEICRDAWVTERPAKRFAGRGVSILLNPSASHFAFGKQAIRERLTREGAAAIDGVAAYVNLLGNESGRAIFDGGSLFAQSADEGTGRLIASAKRFSYAACCLTMVDFEVPERQVPAGEGTIPSGFSIPAAPSAKPKKSPPSEEVFATRFEEFSHAVPLALFDYLRRSGAKGFVLSLSGGADSAACAVMIWLLARQAIDNIGIEGLAGRLPNVTGLADAEDAAGVVRCLLTTVYQGTENSSDTTREAARSVAEAVGAEHHLWEIDPLVAGYTGLAEAAMGRELSWESDDIALQNIQARVRSPGVWMLANLKNALLITTGNRSEASVGYSTMDGDTSGGVSPLAGIDKAFLLDWLQWMEAEGPIGIGPLPALVAINAQRPTAELRPLPDEPGEVKQTDEADLMPYPVLEEIERSAIGRLEPRETTARLVAERFPDYTRDQIEAWVDRFWHLWRISAWKRERMAPGFHLDTHSVDPKTWRRWPILSADQGGRA